MLDLIGGSRVNFYTHINWQKQHANFRFVNQIAAADSSGGVATAEVAVVIAAQASPTQCVCMNAIGAAELGLNAHALTARC